MSFFEDLAKMSKPVAKPHAVINRKDPLDGMRKKFVERADEQVKEIKSAAEKGRWFAKLSDDSYVICMRNGNNVMPIGGNTHFAVKDASSAIKVLEMAKKAAQAKELDKLFQETAFKRKPKETAGEKAK